MAQSKLPLLQRIGIAYNTLRGKDTAKVSAQPIEDISAKPSPKKSQPIDDRPDITALPGGRSSVPSAGYADISTKFRTVNTQFLRTVIPIIRELAMYNEDVGQVLYNLVSLGNTGHKVFFDRGVDSATVDKMRNHLQNKRTDWASGQAGMDGLVNKMFYQIFIGGALSTEWVPNNKLTGIETVVLVNPEEIVFKLDPKTNRYKPYQQPHVNFSPKEQDNLNAVTAGLIPLNPNTYRYFAMNGDTEIPYGIPPYLTALKRISSQNKMNENIDFVVDQLGLIGFLECLLEKPTRIDGESADNYSTRLDTLLTQAKERVLSGFRDGVVAGYKDDHEFNFNTFSKTYEHVISLYKNNEMQLASGLKHDPSLMGRDYNTSETQLSIIFMKMISEFRNIHNIIRHNLQFGYALELRMAGFQFDYLTVQFNRSTIQDDYKYQQAEELKIKNVIDKRLLGIINQDQAADELGYEHPAESEPLVPWEILAGSSPAAPTEPGANASSRDKKRARNKQKKTSDKKTRKDKKAYPKDK